MCQRKIPDDLAHDDETIGDQADGSKLTIDPMVVDEVVDVIVGLDRSVILIINEDQGPVEIAIEFINNSKRSPVVEDPADDKI